MAEMYPNGQNGNGNGNGNGNIFARAVNGAIFTLLSRGLVIVVCAVGGPTVNKILNTLDDIAAKIEAVKTANTTTSAHVSEVDQFVKVGVLQRLEAFQQRLTDEQKRFEGLLEDHEARMRALERPTAAAVPPPRRTVSAAPVVRPPAAVPSTLGLPFFH